MIKLDERLLVCSEYVREGSRLVDVGTDHAYLPIYLIKSGKISKAIASDINEGPLESARNNIRKYGLEGKIESVLSDGLSNISKEDVDDIVIAGMGGELICKIIEEASWLKDDSKRLIIQPMSMEEVLIKYLIENKFKIEQEKAVICNNKSYIIINAAFKEKFKFKQDELYPYIGELKNDAASKKYIEKQIRKLENKSKGFRDGRFNDIINKLKDTIY